MKRGLILLCLFLAVVGGAIHALVNARRASGWRTVHLSTARDAQSGGLRGLLRARMAAVRLAVVDPDDAELLAELAFINASLSHHYGLATATAAEAFLQRLGNRPPAGPAASGAIATRALLTLDGGNWAGAEQLVRPGIAQDPHDIRPLLVLARLQGRLGDLVAASKIAETAAVNAPDAAAARVEWAEARLDLGQPQAALDGLREVLLRAPDHTRALLLTAEAQQAVLGAQADAAPVPGAAKLAAACTRDGPVSPVIEAGCLIHAAAAARLRGDRAKALGHALAAAAIPIEEVRTSSRNAWILAQLGQIDRAHELVARAAQRAGGRMAPLAWARLALTLGRGQPAAQPRWLRAGHPETLLLAARAAFASAGPAALGRVIDDAGKSARAGDPDLRALSGLSGPASAAAPEGDELLGPVQAYVAGLRARLRGDLDAAARLLGRALSGHGDACRAAGEYLVVMRMLRRPLGHELEALAASNHDCMNLALPPPRRDPRVVDPRRDTGVRRPKH
jgi:tetratricopeptide (TPR) repeat protein